MEYEVSNPFYGFKQRKYSNETMRSLRKYIDRYGLKADNEGYNEVIERLQLLINNDKLRTLEEKLADQEEYLNGNS